MCPSIFVKQRKFYFPSKSQFESIILSHEIFLLSYDIPLQHASNYLCTYELLYFFKTLLRNVCEKFMALFNTLHHMESPST